MDYPFSALLASLLEKQAHREEVDLAELAQEVVKCFGSSSAAVEVLLAHARGKIHQGTLSAHLYDTIANDSAVRDVLTTGHLAKLLARFDIFHKTTDPRILGFPNRCFDDRSQSERREYFERGNILIIDADSLDLDRIREVLSREKIMD